MNREFVDKDRLLEILNERLHEYDECRECYFTGAVTLLRNTDQEGCNWSRDMILRCSTRSSNSCNLIGNRVINEVAQQYNLKGLPDKNDKDA
jgi:hypothetical protein